MTDTEVIRKLNDFISEKNKEITKENSSMMKIVDGGQELTSKECQRVDYLSGYSKAYNEMVNFILNELLNK